LIIFGQISIFVPSLSVIFLNNAYMLCPCNLWTFFYISPRCCHSPECFSQ